MQGQEPTAEEVDLEKSMRTTRPLMVGGKGRACALWLTGGSDLIRRGIRSRPWCFRSGPSKAAYLAAWCRNHKQLDSFPSLSSSFPSVASVRLGEASVRFGQVRPSVGCFFASQCCCVKHPSLPKVSDFIGLGYSGIKATVE